MLYVTLPNRFPLSLSLFVEFLIDLYLTYKNKSKIAVQLSLWCPLVSILFGCESNERWNELYAIVIANNGSHAFLSGPH